jgi:DNA polymerase/3'-5' exonuclease PolX
MNPDDTFSCGDPPILARMPLATARRYADQIVTWLTPCCHRIEIAGSIRRLRPDCGDIDLVVIPKIEVQKDMLGEVIAVKNLLHAFLADYVSNPENGASWQTGRNDPKLQCIIQLRKCQLDIYFADESTWTTRLICRTGSTQHNIWICQRAIQRGGTWKPYDGLWLGGIKRPLDTEESFYRELGLALIDPANRELDWINRNVTSHEL